MAADYTWEQASTAASDYRPESSRNLGWWAMLAILFSILIHCILYIVLNAMQWSLRDTTEMQEQIVFQNQSRRLTIDSEKLEEMLPQPMKASDPVEQTNLSQTLVDEKLDEFDLLEQLPDVEIKLTPEVTSAQIFMNKAPTAPSNMVKESLGRLEIASANVMTKDLKEMREKLLDAEVASPDQPVLELNMQDTTSTVNTDEFLKKAAMKAVGGDGSSITNAFSNLDSLIANTGGGLPEGTKPIMMPTDLLFDYNEFQLKEGARLSLMKLAFLIQTNPNSRFIIEGHTDSLGGDDYNYQLSLKRAGAVRDWLLETLKIGADNIQAVGYGKTRPLPGVPSDGSITDQALNRRVEIVIQRKK